VPSADKRARKKENARAAREQREAAEKRRKRIRSTTTIAIVVALFVGVVVLLSVVGSDKKKATPPTTQNGCSTTVPSKGKQQSFSKPAYPTFDPNKKYVATVSTSCGTFQITLDTKNAPKGAGNFAFLADKGFYNGLQWARAAKDFVIQGGDYAGDTSGDAGYSIVTETPKNGFKLGSVGWAKTGSDPAGTAGSEFFVVTGNSTSALNQKVGGKVQYGAFGDVTSGLDVAQKIMSFAPDTGDGPLTQPVYINKVTVASGQVGATTSSSPTVSPSVSTSTAAPPR
jgi:cyclophilin family peptidyl-prolyl cis-trans isomerase